MKDISGCATGTVRTSGRRCFETLIAVDEYPSWIGEYVRAVHVLERDSRGHPTRAQAVVHIAQSPFGKDFELDLRVLSELPRAVRLSRVPAHENDEDRLELVWRVERGAVTTVTLEFAARISVLPTWLPVGGAGDAIAVAAVEAAIDALDERRSPSRQRA